MKKILILAGILALMGSCTPSNKITIKGHVKFTDPQMKMTLFSWDDHVKDTVATVFPDANGDYSITADIEKPGVYFLECGYWQRVSLWAEDEDMTIDFRGVDTARIKIKNPPFVQIKGSPKNEIMNDLNYNSFRHYQNMIAISQAAYRAEFASKEDKDKLSVTLYEANDTDLKERVRFLMDKYAGSTSVLAAVSHLNPVKDEEEIDAALDAILAARPGYKPAEEMRAKIADQRERIKRMMVGQPAPLFTCPNPEGKEIGPETFRGKILLIDFWASWCGPCRGEVPNLKRCYAQFKDKGVEFLSVSIDQSEEAWKKAMAEEAMSWPQAHAPKAGADILDLYQFNGIPFIILLDAEGKIVAKNLRGDAIRTTIEDLLKGVRPEDKAKQKAAAAMPAAGGSMAMIPATPIKRK